jgi:hypothetical protein
MQSVGLYLQHAANAKRSNFEEFNLFGRSAYNRYYYAAFLHLRAVLVKINPDWHKLSHASYPDVLAGTIQKKIKSFRRRAMKIPDADAIKVCNEAISAIKNLTELITRAYATRVAADYHPEIPIEDKSGGRFVLNTVGITEAHSWPDKTIFFSAVIERAWKMADA